MTIPKAIPRVALVTGGAKRIGRAIALALAEAGFDLALHYRHSAEEAEATRQDILALGRRVALLPAALEREEEVAALLPAATAALGPVGVLVNNASAFRRDEWHDATRASWDSHIEPNLRAPFVLTQQVARLLPRGQQGNVINILDQRVWRLTPGFMSYTLSKAALWTLTQTLAQALAPSSRVNAIGPGPTLANTRQSPDDFRAQAEALLLRRGPSLEEFAAAIAFILEAGSVTGQMIALDGGQHLAWQTPDVMGVE